MDTETKKELGRVRGEMKKGFAATDVRMGALGTRLDNKIDTVAKKLDTKIDAVAKKLDTKIDLVAKKLGTKIDFVAKNLDTKINDVRDTLDAKIDKVIDTMATKEDIRELGEQVRALTGIVRAAIPSGDSVVTPLQELQLDHAALSGQVSRHEMRIVSLEEKVK